MDKTIPIYIAVEDDLSEAVLKTILRQSGRPFAVGHCLGKQGSGYLKKKLESFNKAAKGLPFIILTDLDRTECPPSLIDSWISFKKNDNLLFRIAVREVESWVMAHRSAFSSFLGIAGTKIPLNTDTLIEDPKAFLISLASGSKNRTLRESVVPRPGSTAKMGPDYNGVLIDFVQTEWKAEEAAKHSPSLSRAFTAIKNFQPV
jgi:hypothetical protein